MELLAAVARDPGAADELVIAELVEVPATFAGLR
jgi:hypothetical protein